MKTSAELLDTVRTVIKEVCKRPVGPLEPDDDLVERLGLDSLEGLQILARLESRVGVRFPDDRLTELRTLRAIVDALRANSSREER